MLHELLPRHTGPSDPSPSYASMPYETLFRWSAASHWLLEQAREPSVFECRSPRHHTQPWRLPSHLWKSREYHAQYEYLCSCVTAARAKHLTDPPSGGRRKLARDNDTTWSSRCMTLHPHSVDEALLKNIILHGRNWIAEQMSSFQ